MANTYRIQVITKDKTAVGEYCDAQYFDVPDDMTVDEFKKQYESVIEDEKARRIANWVDAIKNPPAAIEPTKEQLQAEEAAILEQKAMLDARVSEIAAKVAEIDAKVEKDIKGK